MKVTIIGAGRTGSNTAFALQCAGTVAEIQMLDAHPDLAAGEALDLLHGTSAAGGQDIYAGDYARAADSDIFIITAGLRRKPDESRLDLVNRNVSLFLQILASISEAGFRKDAIFFVVSNPVDILTRLAADRLALPADQVIGLGTMLDTSRLSSLIASELDLHPTQVIAQVLGEHGDTMVPVWSSATCAGFPLSQIPGYNTEFRTKIYERLKGSGAEVIRLKGGAGWAVGLTMSKIIDAIALNQKAVLPVSTIQKGAYGLRDVAISVPTVLGRKGVVEQLEIELWPEELAGLKASAKALDEVYRKIATGTL